jgi:hypothetical protein
MSETVMDIPLGHEVVGRAIKSAARVRGDLVGWTSWSDGRARVRLAALVRTPSDLHSQSTVVAGNSVRRPPNHMREE